MSNNDWLWLVLSGIALMLVTFPTPRGLRLNNPGNIRKTSTRWKGKIDGPDLAFEMFRAPEYGIRAMGRVLDSYGRRGDETVAEIIAAWAPPVENDTDAYIDAVTYDSPLERDTIVDTEVERVELVKQIIHHEQGAQPFSDHFILRSLRMA